MRRVEKLIEQIRRDSDNEDYGTSQGIPQNDIVQYLNDAQDRLQSLILATYPDMFTGEYETSLTANQEAYSVDDNVYLNNRLHVVEFSPTGQSQDYYPLESRTIHERMTETGQPSFYIRRNGQILLNPIPTSSSNSIRVTYERELNDLDFRRARISSTTGTPITSITLYNSSPATDTDVSNLSIGDYICVVDKDGNVKAKNIPVTAGGTTSVTVDSHTLGSGESISDGDYVVLGRYTTTHSELPDLCERYLIVYATYKMFMRDSSEDLKPKLTELGILEDEIVQSFADISKDVDYIPIFDETIL